MIPILYRQDEDNFTSNGLGRLTECVSCIVTEERNGIYECQFQYPITGEMYPEIMEGRVIAVIHDDAHDIQPFDIYARSAPLNGLVTFYAHHISYRLGNVILKPVQASSCAEAFVAIKNNTYNSNPFTFWTDKAVSGTWNNKTPAAVKSILAGQEGSILDVYGTGEYEWDGFTVKLYLHRGGNNGVSIRYGVNLTDLTQTTDRSGTYTAAAPYWVASDTGDVITLPEGYVVNPNAEPVLVPWTNENGEIITTETGEPIEFAVPDIRPIPMDLSEYFETEPTPEQMRTKAIQKMNSAESWLMDENITVKFADLAHTEEYKNVAALQRVKLCDRVNVYCGPMGVSAVSVQVIRVVFNVLTELYDEIELGKARRSYSDTIMEKVNTALDVVAENSVSRSVLEAAVANATEQITGAKGGHVRFIYDANGEMQEILIMDTDDINTAVKVWRWNSGGLGFSSHGYNGPYDLAMTQDGAFVADFITAGHMSAARLSGGVIDGETILAKLLKIINSDNEVIASFRDTVVLGKTNDMHAQIDFNSFELFNKDGSVIAAMGDSRKSDGVADITEISIGTGFVPVYITLNCNVYDPEDISVRVSGTPATFTYIGENRLQVFSPIPESGNIITIDYTTTDAIPYFTFGKQATVSNRGVYSFLEGYDNEAIGPYSHAEGRFTEALGIQAHAEGFHTEAHDVAHAEGYYTYASGFGSHAEGYQTMARSSFQHVFGKYNDTDNQDVYVEIVGNGSSNGRQNARTLDWSGNETISGSYLQSSDARLKTECGEVPEVADIPARRFRWNDKKVSHDDKEHLGYFAQDVEAVAPYLVDTDAMGYKSLDYIGLLVAKIASLERRVTELEHAMEVKPK